MQAVCPVSNDVDWFCVCDRNRMGRLLAQRLPRGHPACHCRQEMDPSSEDINTTTKITRILKYAGGLDHILVACIRQNVFGFAKVGVVEDTQVGGTPRSTDSSVDANQGYS
jgi:hypothetical protein